METNVKTKWNVDAAHSEVGFKVKHMMISTVSGHFSDFDASVETDQDDAKQHRYDFMFHNSALPVRIPIP